jgi:hypothetical protein
LQTIPKKKAGFDTRQQIKAGFFTFLAQAIKKCKYFFHA